MSKVILIGASPEAYWDHRWIPDLVICADGGIDHAFRLGLTPDLVIGDSDSAASLPPGVKQIRLPAEKNVTDMEACVNFAVGCHAEEIAILGATGGRLDHFLGNIGLLERAGDGAFILDAAHEIRSLSSAGVHINSPHRRYFSVIPLDAEARGVTIRNAKYPLENATLKRTATLGVSNEPLPDTPFFVAVGQGKAILVLSE